MYPGFLCGVIKSCVVVPASLLTGFDFEEVVGIVVEVEFYPGLADWSKAFPLMIEAFTQALERLSKGDKEALSTRPGSGYLSASNLR